MTPEGQWPIIKNSPLRSCVGGGDGEDMTKENFNKLLSSAEQMVAYGKGAAAEREKIANPDLIAGWIRERV